MLALLLLACFSLAIVNADPLKYDFQNPKNIHAVLVAAEACNERCSLSYSTEAEVAHTYHFLLEHEVPAENIILFMDGSIANNTKINPYPGTLYTDVNRTRNYAYGLKVDYAGENVTIGNYLAVLQGDSSKIKGGSGRVLKSTSNSRVFISHEGHGESGVLFIREDGLMSAKKLNDALKKMEKKRMFKELTFYLMACFSGSMFNGHLDKNGKVYAVTAANTHESAYSIDKIETKINGTVYEIEVNTEFGKAWLTDSESHDTRIETLAEQYKETVPLVTKSHVKHYGNLEIAKETVSNFEGPTNLNHPVFLNKLNIFIGENQENENAIPIAPIATYLLLKREIEKTKDHGIKNRLEDKLVEMEQERHTIKLYVTKIFNSLRQNIKDIYVPPKSITQLDCHDDVVQFINKNCRKMFKSIFIGDFFTPMAILCERKMKSRRIIHQMRKYCSNK